MVYKEIFTNTAEYTKFVKFFLFENNPLYGMCLSSEGLQGVVGSLNLSMEKFDVEYSH